MALPDDEEDRIEIFIQELLKTENRLTAQSIFIIPKPLPLKYNQIFKSNRVLIIKDAHVLSPSPFFKGKYTSKQKSTYNIEHGVVSSSDNEHKWTIQQEEVMYSPKDHFPFRLLYISGSLLPTENEHNEVKEKKIPYYQTDLVIDYIKNKDSSILDLMHRECLAFQQSFIYIKGFFKDFLDRLTHLYQELCSMISLEDQLYVETLMLYYLSDFIWKQVQVECQQDDMKIRNKPKKSLKDFGLRKELLPLENYLGPCFTVLSKFDSIIGNPTQKKYELNQIMEILTHEVTLNLTEEETSDDLLPFMAYFASKLQNPASLLFYMKNISLGQHPVESVLDYILTTFEASVTFLLSDAPIENITKPQKKFMSPINRSSLPRIDFGKSSATEEGDFLTSLRSMEDGSSSLFK